MYTPGAGSTGGSGNPTNSISWTQVCASGGGLLVIALEANNSGGDDITSVTYNGVSATLLDKTFGTSENIWFYYLKNPAPGSHTVSVTKTTATQFAGSSQFYNNIAQAGTFDSSNKNTGTGTTFTATTTSVASACLTVMVYRWQQGSETAGTGTVIRNPNSIAIADGDIPKSPPGSVSLIINGVNSNWLYIIATFAPSSGSGGAFLAAF